MRLEALEPANRLRIGTVEFDASARSELASRLGSPPVVDVAQLASVPVAVSPAYLDALRHLGCVLDAALRGIVARYGEDPRIRRIYALPAALEAIVKRASSLPYRVGYYRPDFVYDTSGHPRICEIGARYPLNGWMLSARASLAYAPYAAKLGLAVQAEQPNFIAQLCESYPAGACVAMLHAREAGTEIFLLAQAMRERGLRFVQAHPSQLDVRAGRLHAAGAPVDACILEMDRTELPLIPAQALDALLASGAYFNDVRTLILVHDKRTLAVLWDEAIMREMLSDDDYAWLRAFLIPSWVATDRDACESLLAIDGDLIAKRSSGGRGVDALVRSECGDAAWSERVRGQWASDMYQRYLEQASFAVPDELRPIHFVGMQLCRDATSFG
ncbi:MAG: hypothetical protein KGN02_12820, partial [bacterium]|nr:hypothetical protein [bacterium]